MAIGHTATITNGNKRHASKERQGKASGKLK
jgi:hypothetical protein